MSIKNNSKPLMIGVTGGKGGVGKSTFAILLLCELLKKNKKVLLCDCDVECPNNYLLLGEKLINSVQKIFGTFPKLDKRKCRKCGICAQTCKSNAIFYKPGEYPIFIKDLCSGCGACAAACPFGAIKEEKEETGKIFLNKIKVENLQSQAWLITGLAKKGIEESGPIVREVKKFAQSFAKKVGADVILFDTAAGTHCPVINALLDVDYAFVVTEPTPMGLHDLKLMIHLLKKLKIKSKVILNQADLGDRSAIEKFARKHKIKIERSIPYSKELADFYSKGQLLEYFFKN